MAAEPSQREVEVKLGDISQDEPNQVRVKDSMTGIWSGWVDQDDFIKRIRGRPDFKDTIKEINEKVKAAKEKQHASPLTAETPVPHSKVRVWRDDTSKRGPLYWVQIQRPGSDTLEEYAYGRLKSTPSNIPEDVAIKKEAEKQHAVLEKEWEEMQAKKAPEQHTLEIANVQSDRSPLDNGFDPKKHVTITYLLDGKERHDNLTSMVHMIMAAPAPYPKDAAAMLGRAVEDKVAYLKEQCRPPEMAVSEPKAEEFLEVEEKTTSPPAALPEASADGGEGPTPKQAAAPADMPANIPPQLRDPRFRFVLVKRRGKSPIEQGWQHDANYPYDHERLAAHLADEGNYGVLCGNGPTVIDADALEVQEAVRAHLPPTFTVRTGRESGEGRHFYFRCEDLPGPIRLARPGDVKGTIGDVQHMGKQVIGPGSIHPSGNRYEVLEDLPITTITAEQLRYALRDYLPPVEMDIPEDIKREMPHGDSELDQLRVEKVIPLDGLTRHGSKYQGPCPWHGSDGGQNFTIDMDKNVWYCFRHDSGGGPLQAIAVMENVISCEESRRGKLRGDKFREALVFAEEKHGLIRTPRSDKARPDDKKVDGKDNNRKAGAAARQLVEVAKQGGRAEYFHDVAQVPYARIERDGHYEVRAVRESDYAEWLTVLNYDIEGLAPEEAAAKRAVATLAVIARKGKERQVYLRHGAHDGAFYYDLCNDRWQAVRITRDGWDVVDDPPAMFRRYDHMRPQVMPIRPSGEHWALKALVDLANIGQTGREILTVQLHVLNVADIDQMGGGTLGLEGTGKTATQKLAVAVADPSTDAESSLPKSKNDLTLHLSTHCLASFDNLSHITEDQSDDLSRSGTGASDSLRALYTDNGTNRRRYRTPTFFNGINVTGAKPDFYDRNIIYRTLETFDGPRLSKNKLTAKLEELLPHALGEIFDNLSNAMRFRDEFKEEDRWTPRMVDWYLWALAVSRAMGKADGWLEGVFKPMIDRRDYDAIADHPLTRALEFVASQRGYVGTASELYSHLNDNDQKIPFKCQIDTKDRNWPRSAGSFGMRIKPLIKSLRSREVFVYKRQWSNLKKYNSTLSGLDRARGGLEDDFYRESDDIYVISKVELELGRDDDVGTGGK